MVKFTRQIMLAGLVLAATACQTTPDARQQRLYDTHAHFISDDQARYPLDPNGSARQSVEVIRQRLTAHPWSAATVLAVWDAEQVSGGAAVQYNTAYKTNNSYILDTSDAHPGRIAPVIILDARLPETPAKLRQLVTQRGVTGLRLTGPAAADGSWPWLDSPEAQRTWAEADRLGIAIVLMYIGVDSAPSADALARIERLAARYSRVRVVLDHVGWPGNAAAPDHGLTPAHHALAKRRNIYFKLTTINFDRLAEQHAEAGPFVRAVVDLYGADRVMWGSDIGNTSHPFPEMVARARAATAVLTARERRKVLHDTGERTFARR